MFEDQTPYPVPPEEDNTEAGGPIYEPEAYDASVLRQLTEGINAVVHQEEHIPKGMDAPTILVDLAIHGQTEAMRRAATLELSAWVRRLTVLNNRFQNIVTEMSREVGNVAQDFPQAAEINKKLEEIYSSNMNGLAATIERVNGISNTRDIAEVLGTKQYVRDQINLFAPGALDA